MSLVNGILNEQFNVTLRMLKERFPDSGYRCKGSRLAPSATDPTNFTFTSPLMTWRDLIGFTPRPLVQNSTTHNLLLS
jgi:hypothetical protein